MQVAGDVLLPDEIYLKLEQTVIDVLFQKHLAPIVPAVEALEHYDVIPEFIPLNIIKVTVDLIFGKITDNAGSCRINTAGLQQWLVCFSVTSQYLSHAIVPLSQWIANDFPPWAAICSLQKIT